MVTQSKSSLCFICFHKIKRTCKRWLGQVFNKNSQFLSFDGRTSTYLNWVHWVKIWIYSIRAQFMNVIANWIKLWQIVELILIDWRHEIFMSKKTPKIFYFFFFFILLSLFKFRCTYWNIWKRKTIFINVLYSKAFSISLSC